MDRLKNILIKLLIITAISVTLAVVYMSCSNLYATQKYRFVKSTGEIDVDMLERTLERIENNYQTKTMRIYNHVPTKQEIGGEGYTVIYSTCVEFAYHYQIINGTTFSFRLDRN